MKVPSVPLYDTFSGTFLPELLTPRSRVKVLWSTISLIGHVLLGSNPFGNAETFLSSTPAEVPTLTVTVPAASTAVIAKVAPYAGSVDLG